MKVHNSARKHGITPEDTLHAAEHAVFVADLDDHPARQLRLGFDPPGMGRDPARKPRTPSSTSWSPVIAAAQMATGTSVSASCSKTPGPSSPTPNTTNSAMTSIQRTSSTSTKPAWTAHGQR